LRFVSLAQRKARAGEYADLERYLSDAHLGLQRMTEILRELMEVGRQAHEGLAQPQILPLSELVAHALRTTAAQAEQKQIAIEVENALPENVFPRYDARLSQVLANLIKNAIDADPENARVRLSLTVPANGCLTIRVEDQGPGIRPEVLSRLFTPFVTTKPRGTGHGLGLAISRDLVVSLGGTLTVANRGAEAAARDGCVATVTLPLQ
jgi:two-component system C4-dicarboxylate transport sensor histidine kinase DctB